MIRERHPGTFFFAKHTWFVHKYKSQAKKLRQKKPITCQKRPFLQASNLILAMGSMLRLILRFILDMRNRRIMGCKNGPSATHSTLRRRKRHLKFNFDISNTDILQKKLIQKDLPIRKRTLSHYQAYFLSYNFCKT